MENVNITNARKNLYGLVQQADDSHKPILISGKTASAVLISASDWAAIEETLALNAVPGLADSIHAGMHEPLSEGLNAKEIDWDAL